MTERLGEAVIEVGADTSGLPADVKRGVGGAFSSAQSTVKSAGDRAGSTFRSSFSNRLRGLGSTVGVALGAAGLVAVAKSAVTIAAQFEQSLNILQAATGATQKQMSALSDQAIQIGQDTVFSANDAAAAMLELGKAGFNAGQTMKAVPEVMNLAATEGMALDAAAGTVTSTLAQFDLKAKDAGIAVNALAGASTASKASVTGLAESLTLVGSSAASTGYTVAQTTAALAALAQGGLEGSIAGTSLASVFNHLTPMTEKASGMMKKLNIDFTNADGSFKSIATVAEILQDRFKGMNAESRKIAIAAIFGKDASVIAAVNALIKSGAEGIRKYTKASEDQGAAAKLSRARMSGMAGAIEAVKGAAETAALELGDLLGPAIIKGAHGLNGALKDLGPVIENIKDETEEWLPVLRDVGGDMKSLLLPPLGLAVSGLKTLANIVDDLPGPVKTIGIEAAILAVAFNKASGSVAAMTANVRGNMAALQQWRAEMTYAETRAGAVATATGKLGGAAKQAAGIGGMLLLTQSMSSATSKGQSLSSMLTGSLGGAMTGLAVGGPIGALVGTVAGGGLAALTGAFADNKRKAEAQARALAESKAKLAAYRAFVDNLTDSLNENTGAFSQNSKAIIRHALIDPKTGAWAKWGGQLDKAGISLRTLISATLRHPAAVKAVNGVLDKQQAAIDRLRGKQAGLLKQYGAQPALYSAMLAKNKALIKGHLDLIAAVRKQVGAGRESQADWKRRRDDLAAVNKALGITKERYEQLPKRVQVRMDDIKGIPRTLEDLNAVTKGVKGLTVGDWKLLLRTANFDEVHNDLNKAAHDAAKAGKASGYGFERQFNAALQPLIAGLTDTTRRGTRGAENISRDGGRTGGKVYAGGWLTGVGPLPSKIAAIVRSATNQQDVARQGGASTGAAFSSGLTAGIHSAVDSVVGAARAVARAAINAAAAEAKVKSPSKEMHRIGRFMGKGLELGLTSTKKSLVDTTNDLISTLIEGMSKAAKKSTQATIAEFRRQAIPLAREIDRVKAKIEEANQFRRSTTSGIIGGFGLTGTGFDSLIRGMQVSAQKAKDWAKSLAQLKAGGLNKTTFAQLVSAGPEALAQAQAILSREGGIGQVNALQTQINAAAKAAGKTAGDELYAGIRAKRAALADEFRRLAHEFVREVRGGLHGDGDRVRRVVRTDGSSATTVVRDDGRTTTRTRGDGDVTLIQNFYGPATGGERLREMNWALRYATGERRLARVG